MHTELERSNCGAMIIQHLKALNSKKILLASASPRRLEILQNLGLQPEVRIRRPDPLHPDTLEPKVAATGAPLPWPSFVS